MCIRMQKKISALQSRSIAVAVPGWRDFRWSRFSALYFSVSSEVLLLLFFAGSHTHETPVFGRAPHLAQCSVLAVLKFEIIHGQGTPLFHLTPGPHNVAGQERTESPQLRPCTVQCCSRPAVRTCTSLSSLPVKQDFPPLFPSGLCSLSLEGERESQRTDLFSPALEFSFTLSWPVYLPERVDGCCPPEGSAHSFLPKCQALQPEKCPVGFLQSTPDTGLTFSWICTCLSLQLQFVFRSFVWSCDAWGLP